MRFSLGLLLLLLWANAVCGITIETVPVGDIGNPNDPATGNLFGGVNYAYNIGKYEVTVGQYTAFLNAIAAADPYGLYITVMANDRHIAGIARSGVSGSYAYSVIGSPNHPITYVSWGDAARFANWLNNGQPVRVEGLGTTETGAYLLNGAMSSTTLSAVTRTTNAAWFLPTENEWYKAAYYQPATQGGDFDGYWAYPMKTNSDPYSDQPPGSAPDNSRVGNFYQDDNIANGFDDGYAATGSANYVTSQNYLTDVGAYSSSPSYYGTFDQGGNVFEWNETKNVGTGRGRLGGAWILGPDVLLAGETSFADDPTGQYSFTGFRVATTIPEPSSLALIALAAVGFGFNCRRD